MDPRHRIGRGLRLASQPNDTPPATAPPPAPSTICQTLTNRIGGSAPGSPLKYQQLSTARNRRSACPDNGIMQFESAIIAAIETR
jgi:hypothetical protein